MIVCPATPSDSSQKVDDTDSRLLVFDHCPRERNGQVETPWAGASGVQIHDAVMVFNLRTMRMSIDDDLDAGGGRNHVQVLYGMNKIEQASAEFDGFGGW